MTEKSYAQNTKYQRNIRIHKTVKLIYFQKSKLRTLKSYNKCKD